MKLKLILLIIVLFIGYFSITDTMSENFKDIVRTIKYNNPLSLSGDTITVDQEFKGKKFYFDKIKIGNILIDKDKLRLMKKIPFTCPNTYIWSDNNQGGCKNDNLCLNDQCIDGKDIVNLNTFWPIGTIIAFFNLVSEIPEGWKLCDGKPYTTKSGQIIKVPDLRNKFIIGAGGNYKLGEVGGANYVKLETSQVPDHTHRHFPGNAGFGCEDSYKTNVLDSLDISVSGNSISRLTIDYPSRKDDSMGSHRSYPANFHPADFNYPNFNFKWWEVPDVNSRKLPKNNDYIFKSGNLKGRYGRPHQNQPKYKTMFYIMRVENEPKEKEVTLSISELNEVVNERKPSDVGQITGNTRYAQLAAQLRRANKQPIV